mmetsp:Transcript_594/g.715  ORF Transcript_594/g.715 Transcript_594/m.715 type:complete len:666 (+) Transcript_594:440-2437(+)|eukprot:CAMPEP_0197852652 /NCGR_PEP_ID=MMETSP1438-20131217/21153_1 /TAXON_ID=1461541 /ORGANISM="Pterosperma sp., Strain CCMP1384" /LENGTH=665 /DNA_ID=CAMNT_0043466807 /DNA_START=422 /DNA_END=2419 /DNA_ORIENTATION=-
MSFAANKFLAAALVLGALIANSPHTLVHGQPSAPGEWSTYSQPSELSPQEEKEINAVFASAEAQAASDQHGIAGQAILPSGIEIHTATYEEHHPTGPQSCKASGRLPEESTFRTVLKPHVKCRKGWQDFPSNAVVISNAPGAMGILKKSGVVKPAVEVIGVLSKHHVSGKAVNQVVKEFSSQQHFFIHSTKTHGNSTLVDRMLRMSAAQKLTFVVVSNTEATALTPEWIEAVKELFKRHPKLGLVGGHAAIINGKPFAAQNSGFKFAEMLVGGPLAVRRDAYMQASVYLSSSETCGTKSGACSDPAQGLSSRIWAAGYQVGYLGTTTGIPPLPCGEIIGSKQKQKVKQLVAMATTALEQGQPTNKAAALFETSCTCRRKGVSLTAIVQYFKRPEGVRPIAGNFNAVGDSLEVIINDDSLSEGDQWSRALKNGFIAYSHDIHEIRGYNRYSRFANTDYVALMQDDDVPKDRNWVKRAASLFQTHEKLGMVGGFRGRMDVGKRFDKGTGQMWGKKYGPKYLPIPLKDHKLQMQYMPCYKVNAAPLFADRRVLFELGGFNANFSCVGDSGIDFDFEYSIRLWASGYEVGLGEFRIRHGAMDKKGAASNTGTRANKKKWRARRNAERFNNAQIYAMYKQFHHKKGTALAMQAFNRERAAATKARKRGKI